LYQFTVAFAYRYDQVGSQSVLHKRKASPLIQGFLHICAGGTVGVRVPDIYAGRWIDDHEDGPGPEDIRRKNCLLLGGSKSRAKDNCSDCEEFTKGHNDPPATREVYTSLTDDDNG
jgi:hypothetical protein